MNINKFLTLTFCILIGIIIIEGIYYFFLTSSKKQIQISKPKIQNQPENFKILYQAPGDREGRTVIYNDSTRRFSGVGEIYYPQSTSPKLYYLVGMVKGWEKIDNSKDRYLLLENSMTKQILPKVRVAFESSNLFDSESNSTALAIDNLTTGKKESLGSVRSLNQLQFNQWIKKGDSVAVLIFLTNDEKKERRDKNNQLLALWLYIRRW